MKIKPEVFTLLRSGSICMALTQFYKLLTSTFSYDIRLQMESADEIKKMRKSVQSKKVKFLL